LQPRRRRSESKKILLTGLSTRALAESAAASTHGFVTLDFFGDRDQRDLSEGYSLLRDFSMPFSPEGLLEASRGLEFDALVYTSNLENHPEVVEALARGRVLLGNSPESIRQVRDWQVLRRFCRESLISFPPTLLPGEEKEADSSIRWLLKPACSGGGHLIEQWDGRPLKKTQVLQAYVTGTPASVLFAADGQKSVVLGLTEQLIGENGFGVSGQRWCGNILPFAPQKSASIFAGLERAVSFFTRQFDLCGVNGIDIIVDDGPDGTPAWYFLEVNPRYTGAMELVEHAYGLNIFRIHMEAMVGKLPGFSLLNRISGSYYGKGIVFAKQDITVPETGAWLEKRRRDIPFPGDVVDAGHPVCTVFSQGDDRKSCLSNLLANASAVRRETGDKTED